MRVLVFGASITQGFWDADGGWVHRLRKVYDLQKIEGKNDDPPTIFNLGVSGDSSDDVLARFDNEAKARSWPGEEFTMLFSVGLNDSRILNGENFSNTDRFRRNLTELLRLVKRYSNRVLFIGLTPCVDSRTNPVGWNNTVSYKNGRIKEFDNTMREFCEQNKVNFVEIYEPFQEQQSKTDMLPDGLHPDATGHQFIADIVKPRLEELLHDQRS